MIGTDNPRFAANPNVQLVASFNSRQSRESIRQNANRHAPVNREIDRIMRANYSRSFS